MNLKKYYPKRDLWSHKGQFGYGYYFTCSNCGDRTFCEKDGSKLICIKDSSVVEQRVPAQ